jgi:hypothetical protein
MGERAFARATREGLRGGSSLYARKGAGSPAPGPFWCRRFPLNWTSGNVTPVSANIDRNGRCCIFSSIFYAGMLSL